MAVSQVAAVVEAHRQHRVAGLAERHVDRLIGGAAGVGLDICGFRAEEFLHPFDGERLHLVDEFAAVVVALARVAFGVFVGQHRSLRGAYRTRGEVFAGDEFNAVGLPFASWSMIAATSGSAARTAAMSS